jgi:3-dehydroquinate dehydratase-2
MATILLINGPNLNLLGDREPEVYGSTTLADLVAQAERAADTRGHDLEHVQSNHEGALVDAIPAARGRCAAIVINPGALTHYSYAIADALGAFTGVKIELHLSNTHTREAWRHRSVVSPYVTGIVAGLGGAGYRIAVDAAADLLGA